jgi:recombinational DNA repair protein (RecF pathway)
MWVKAAGLMKPGSKLAPFLQYGDELQIRLAPGRAGMPILTGVVAARPHPEWRASLKHLALLWFMLESAVLASGTPKANEASFQLVVNLIRSAPDETGIFGALCVYCLKMLAIHGLLPDLMYCAESGLPFAPDEPAFLLPSGEGLIGREAYNTKYARGSANLIRLDAPRRQRWLTLLHGALLRYAERGCDLTDALTLLDLCAKLVGETAGKEPGSATHLRRTLEGRSK